MAYYNSINNTRHMQQQNTAQVYKKQNCRDLLEDVCAADFYALDLRLYLDTHPYDAKALEMYAEAVKTYKAAKAAYENECEVISPYSAGKCGDWDWKCNPWPWNL